MRFKSSLMYKFSCEQCASEYVGMTARTLGTRGDGTRRGQLPKAARLTRRLIRQYVIIEIVAALHLTPVILKY